MMNSLVVWDGFSRAASGCFERAFKSSQYQDVTLISEDCQEFGAHRMILSASSEKFSKILQLKSQDRNPVIFLRGMNASQVSGLLHFIYEGKVEVATKELNTFINLVTEFEIEGLQKDLIGENTKKETEKVTDTVTDTESELETELKCSDISMTNEGNNDLSVLDETTNFKEDEYVADVKVETIIHPVVTENDSYFKSSEFLESSVKQQDGYHHCMKCHYKTKRKELLRTHMSSNHDGPKLICPVEACRRMYSNKANLRAHMRSCHNCDKCEETFECNNDVKKHKRIVHSIL